MSTYMSNTTEAADVRCPYCNGLVFGRDRHEFHNADCPHGKVLQGQRKDFGPSTHADDRTATLRARQPGPWTRIHRRCVLEGDADIWGVIEDETKGDVLVLKSALYMATQMAWLEKLRRDE